MEEKRGGCIGGFFKIVGGIVIAIFVLGLLGNLLNSCGSSRSRGYSSSYNSSSTGSYSSSAGSNSRVASTPKPTPKDNLTMGQRNALDTAKSYLSVMPFSRTGLIEQLEYEGYTHDEALYGVDHCGANWKDQAVKMAADYLETMSFSKSGLIEQLEYEGFTHEQAVYGVEQNGY